MIKITTHILDTTKGKPAQNVKISLHKSTNNSFIEVANGYTNDDGRIPDLVPTTTMLEAGIYKMKFETKEYFEAQQIATFYPYVEIVFEVNDNQHYHIPLLLNPFGYSTYRGS